jgi:hypothetical protein
MFTFKSIYVNVGFEVVFENLKDKFHGDFISNWCHSTMLSKIFQGRTKLQYPTHNEEPPQVQVNNAKAP